MKRIEWSDRLQLRHRSPSLYFVDINGDIHTFEGRAIPKICAIQAARYSRAGKWSGTDYLIAVQDGVTPIQVLRGWEDWGVTWPDIARQSFTDLSRERQVQEGDPEWSQWLTMVKRVARYHVAHHPESGLAAAVEEADANGEVLKGLS